MPINTSLTYSISIRVHCEKEMATKKIKGAHEAWESGELGASSEHIKALSVKETKADLDLINEHLGLQPISIRLEKSLIDDFKAIASINHLGYQTLMRQALKRFADCEKKDILRRMASEAKKHKAADLEVEAVEKKTPVRKAA